LWTKNWQAMEPGEGETALDAQFLDRSDIVEESYDANGEMAEDGAIMSQDYAEDVGEGGEEVEEGGQAGKCFQQLIDKPVAEEIKLFEWCPTMDLLAWITADDQLVVQRLSWQRLFSIRTHDQPITALTWRPDGSLPSIRLHSLYTSTAIAHLLRMQQAKSSPWATRTARYRWWTSRTALPTSPPSSTLRRSPACIGRRRRP
jgi:hypothetical protein